MLYPRDYNEDNIKCLKIKHSFNVHTYTNNISSIIFIISSLSLFYYCHDILNKLSIISKIT